MKPLLAALAVLALVSCASPPEEPVPQRPDVIRDELVRAIDAGEAERAVQRITALRRDRLIPADELDAYFSDAVEWMHTEYTDAIRHSRPSEAIQAHQNLATLGEIERDQARLSLLYLDHAIELRDAGNDPAALAVLLRAPELSSLPTAALDEAVRVAMRLNNRHAVGALAEILGPTWRRDNAEAVSFARSEESPVRMSDGVVTIWVNRGLRLENGMGIPDRVIGSGFFVDPRGYVVTNYHVIASEVDPEYEGYSRLYVRLPSDPAVRVPARVVGFSRVFDVALVKVELDAPYVFSFTDIRSLEPGARITAIGSPGGLENSITSGIISATGRRFLQMGDAMQVDVPINPGSSGGPLLDAHGRLVGVVFAGIEQYEGVNFAIPSFWINSFLPDLYSVGSVVHPWIGVAVERVGDGLAVSYVAKESPATEAGLQVGDVITALGDWPADRIGPAQSILLRHGTGSLLRLEWTRQGDRMSGVVLLSPRPESPVELALDADVHHRLYPVLFGMHVERVGAFSLRPNYEVTRVYRGSVADETGISAGDRFAERDFAYDEDLDVVFLRMFIQKRTEGFMQMSIQLPAYVERDNFL